MALIAFNRPDLTRKVLETIRTAAPADLFLIVDGPRPERPDDVPLCAEVRDVLMEIDWPCDVRRRYSEVNLGCEANVELGLDWVFSQTDRAVILEDDCIPDASFFGYCAELLERYADNERVWHVAGNSHWVPPELFTDADYALTTYAAVWGWATWQRAWHTHRSEFPRRHDENPGRPGNAWRPSSASPAPGALVTEAAHRHYAHIARSIDGEEYGWDSHFWLTVASHGGLAATPARNLVANHGYGVGATHTRSNREVTPSEATGLPLRHPTTIDLNKPVQRELELILLRNNGRLSRLARKVVRPLWLRAIARKVVSSRLVWRMVRSLTRRRDSQ